MNKLGDCLKLFSHNQRAYEAVDALMQETGKAAVIHPTGTGKSFIAFKLAEQYPNQRILWLSPSEYIYRTQLENLYQALECGTEEAEAWMAHLKEQIQFMTYAKLMLNVEQIETLQPDFIILDEFHRCGAAEWGKSVVKLLDYYRGCRILGLSATNIRYLDNQRDMADELFDGNIASYLSLGEAIAQGILPKPKYVISMYSYKHELKRLEKRVEAEKNSVLQAEQTKILEQLRRSLEQADGLDVVFARHMEKRAGKYIVFCAGKEHMEEMLAYVNEWFCRIDDNPHVYTIRYDDPAADKMFAAFKADNSGHLCLLFCIDMLNEGVHVDKVDGVILLRPTVSPILYLQQIGRGLCVGDGKSPIIFDIVNNFESLYSIDAVQKDFENAVVLLEKGDAERRKFCDSFQIIDEIKDCRKLFEQLNRNLSLSWEHYYEAAEIYYKQNGNLDIPNAYVTENGLTLGMWLLTQRRVYAGKITGCLSKEQIQKLEAIGMQWENRNDRKFYQGCTALKEYREQNGNTDVNIRFVTEDGFALGRWVSNLRMAYKEGTLDKTRIEQLQEYDMIWDVREFRWNVAYQEAKQYFIKYGNLDVPADYSTSNGVALGTWVRNQKDIHNGKKRNATSLSVEQTAKLEALQIQWQNKHDDKWEKWYQLAKAYYEEHGDLAVCSTYQTEGLALGKWLNEIRLARKRPETSNRRLTAERISRLNQIGMQWE